MVDLLHFATLVVITIFAAAAAVAFDWMLLRAMFVLMRPATAQRIHVPSRLERTTVHLSRVYTPQR